MTAPSYAERARRFLAERTRAADSGREESEQSEERAGGPVEPWWDDIVPAGSAPILHLPPREGVAPIACSRLGPCERHRAGRPCHVA